jgi:5-methylcytosine-specific restriction endonuclease McrA
MTLNANQRTAITARLWKERGPHCQICQKRFASKSDRCLTIDHIIPEGEGGGDSIENLRIVCWECHWAPPPLAIPA